MGQAPNHRKSIVDAPNLRGADAQCCMGCQFYKPIDDESGICQQYEFETECEYVCDSFQAAPAAPEAPPMGAPDMGMAADSLVIHGGTVKALGGGKIGGYLVRFSSADDPDLSGEFFTKQTDFGVHTTAPVYYHHGMDGTLKSRVLGSATMKADEAGVWVEAQLALRDEYEQYIYRMAESGKMGWSSGTAGHLVEREPAGKAWHITRWPLGLDASLTPTPAEPRNAAIPLKTLAANASDLEAAVRAGAEPARPPEGASTAASTRATRTAAGAHVAVMEAVIHPSQENNMDELKQIAENLTAVMSELGNIKTALAKEPAPNPGIAVIPNGEQPFKNIGEQLFAVRAMAEGRASEQQVNRLKAVKATGAAEAPQSDGGFLVQSDFVASIFERAYGVSKLAPLCAKQGIGPNSNGVKIPAVDETSRADGSRWGGVRAYWAAEGGSTTASRPKFRLLDLELKKLFALVYGTDELLADAAAFESFVMRVLPQEIGFKLDDAILNGDGAGKPLGVLAAPALVSVSKESGQAAATIVAQNVMKMRSRLWAGGRANSVWLINQDVEPQLHSMSLSVGTGGVPVYLPATGLSGNMYDTLYGRPVMPIEHCQTLGTVGDIVLADFSQYVLADKGGLQAASSMHVQFLTDEMTFRWTYRVDGLPAWNSALTPFKGSNTQSPYVALATRS